MKLKSPYVVFLLLLLVLPQQLLSWGFTGHRITARIAEARLSEKAGAAVHEILKGQSLVEVSTWADTLRDDPHWKAQSSGQWHYLNVEDGVPYVAPVAPNHDVFTKLTEYEAVLRDKAATREKKEVALKWLVHLVGDIHQPLHVGRGSDRGGNDIKLLWFGEEQKLHRIWDRGFIDRRALDVETYAAMLNGGIDPQMYTEWVECAADDWIAEGRTLRPKIYGYSGSELDEAYYTANLPIVEQRLQMGGVRLAALLNDIFQ